MSRAKAYAKLNLALVVGETRADGKHEVVTVLQAIDLHDEIALERATELEVRGFEGDTLVRDALLALASDTGEEPAWRVTIEKRIPVAAGLGGGSSDAATALVLANSALRDPLAPERLHELAAELGSDVPFFLEGGSRLASGSGTQLEPLQLPDEYTVVLVLPHEETKESTAAVYRRFAERTRARGFATRRARLVEALAAVHTASDLAALPKNDLVSSPLADDLERQGALRADVTGAGPTVYGLFERVADAQAAASSFVGRAQTWICRPAADTRPSGR